MYGFSLVVFSISTLVVLSGTFILSVSFQHHTSKVSSLASHSPDRVSPLYVCYVTCIRFDNSLFDIKTYLFRSEQFNFFMYRSIFQALIPHT